ncbi:MAG: hypothetical protein ACLFR0_09250 [Alphaproteobacteria bacterium]
MLESYAQTQTNAPINQEAPRKILKMVKNERMAGQVPSWETPKSAKDQITTQLADAKTHSTQGQNFQNALALHSNQAHSTTNSEEFGFGDLLDMVNPLHHIPIVGTIYREVTGDEIKPIGKIIGGGIFGGGVGAASGLVNTIVEHETGKDLTGNAAALFLEGRTPKFKSTIDHPEKRLNDTAKGNNEDLPPALLAFSNHGYKPAKNLDIGNIDHADDILAGLPGREPITSVEIKQKVPFKEL